MPSESTVDDLRGALELVRGAALRQRVGRMRISARGTRALLGIQGFTTA
jgi:hypothetical protein